MDEDMTVTITSNSHNTPVNNTTGINDNIFHRVVKNPKELVPNIDKSCTALSAAAQTDVAHKHAIPDSDTENRHDFPNNNVTDKPILIVTP